MAKLTDANGANSAWFTPTGSTYVVLVESGTFQIECRAEAAQAFSTFVSDMNSVGRSVAPICVQGGSSVLFQKDAPSFQYRLVPVGAAGKAQAWE